MLCSIWTCYIDTGLSIALCIMDSRWTPLTWAGMPTWISPLQLVLRFLATLLCRWPLSMVVDDGFSAQPWFWLELPCSALWPYPMVCYTQTFREMCKYENPIVTGAHVGMKCSLSETPDFTHVWTFMISPINCLCALSNRHCLGYIYVYMILVCLPLSLVALSFDLFYWH